MKYLFEFLLWFNLFAHITSEKNEFQYEVVNKEGTIADLMATDIITISNGIEAKLQSTGFTTSYSTTEKKKETRSFLTVNPISETSEKKKENLKPEGITSEHNFEIVPLTLKNSNRNCTELKSGDYDTNQTEQEEQNIATGKKKIIKMKYILQWTKSSNFAFSNIDMHNSQKAFIDRNCRFTNCVVTKSKTLLEDYTQFDAIVFFAKDLVFYNWHEGFFLHRLPIRRSPHQKYVFASLEPVRNLRGLSAQYTNFFNWTWTYKLKSDLKLPFFVVKDKYNNYAAPDDYVLWKMKETMGSVPDTLKETLRNKTKAIAYFDSCTNLQSIGNINALTFVRYIQSHSNITVDTFGSCHNYDCKEEECYEIIRRDYFFILVFEDTMAEDYVTDKILRAVNNNAVPIVFGGANYDKFLPEGSYLNAKDYSARSLADIILFFINNIDQYEEFFRWTNHYTFHKTNENPEDDHLCRICELMNDERWLKEPTVYEDIIAWWSNTKSYNKLSASCRPFDLSDIDFEGPKKSNFIERIVEKSVKAITNIYDSIVSDVKKMWRKIINPVTF